MKKKIERWEREELAGQGDWICWSLIVSHLFIVEDGVVYWEKDWGQDRTPESSYWGYLSTEAILKSLLSVHCPTFETRFYDPWLNCGANISRFVIESLVKKLENGVCSQATTAIVRSFLRSFQAPEMHPAWQLYTSHQSKGGFWFKWLKHHFVSFELKFQAKYLSNTLYQRQKFEWSADIWK